MQLSNRELSKGTRVWYKYGNYETVYGPFVVKRTFSNHQGEHVVLACQKDERTVLLADDDDFGELIFYSSNPQG